MTFRLGRNDWLLLIGAIAGMAIFILLYPSLFPEAALKSGVSKQEIVTQSRAFVQKMGYEASEDHITVELKQDKNQIRYLDRYFGMRDANRLMTDSIPAFYWEIAWHGPKKEPNGVTISAGTGEDSIRWNSGALRLKTNLKGRPFSFESFEKSEDESKNNQVRRQASVESKCRPLASGLAASLIPELDKDWTMTAQPDSGITAASCLYRWEKKTPLAGEKVSLEIEASEGKILRFTKEYLAPSISKGEEKRQGIYDAISFIVQYLLIILLGLYYFVTRLKSDALDLKSGLVPALLILISWTVVFWMQVSGQKGWEILLGFVITTPFVAGGVWLIFIVGEAITREVWPDKLLTIDGLRSRLCFPALGSSLIRGLGYGAALLGLYAILAGGLARVGAPYFSLGDGTLDHWSAPLPAVHILGKTLLGMFYIAVTYCLFFQSWLRKRIRHAGWFGIVLVLYWSFIPLQLPHLLPFPASSFLNATLGLAIFLIFMRRDFITVAATLVAMPLFYYGTAAIHIGGDFTLQGILIFFIVLGMGIYALVCLRSPALPDQITEYVPDYMQRIYERQRIQRELEIARNVQLTFLPRSNPEIPGIEIASFCVPALEVGGDYFDFVRISPRAFGVAIGDVSGKGIPAAFYMTLTKGMFKAQAQCFRSPREVLINLNTLFYENAERGVFISMIYTIFDLDKKKLYIARAGHNPMLIRRSDRAAAEELCPPGIALGFEPGDKFAQTIQEEVFDIRTGDVFLFYTDGLNEAQNRMHREFGEDRLKRVMREGEKDTAAELLDRIRREIAEFIGDAQQHDDMTAVAVKILDV